MELDEISEQLSEGDRYVLLSQVNYRHPVFTAFANPLYSNFTSVQFWKYRQVSFQDNTSVEVLARFDDDSPALCERSHGKGRILLLTSGWHPIDSQLALSSKFVPLLGSILAYTRNRPVFQTSYLVNEPVELMSESDSTIIAKPDGTTVEVADSTSTFRDTSLPGIYEIRQDEETIRFAVNLDHRESDTETAELTELEQLGVVLGKSTSARQRLDRERQLRDRELEGRQKVWQWLVLAVLGLLISETWLASRKSAVGHVAMEGQPDTKEAA